MTTLSEAYIKQTVNSLLSGNREIVSDQFLDAIADMEIAKDIATCFNRNGVGTLDVYVAWVGKANQPLDLEYTGLDRAMGFAVGSK